MSCSIFSQLYLLAHSGERVRKHDREETCGLTTTGDWHLQVGSYTEGGYFES